MPLVELPMSALGHIPSFAHEDKAAKLINHNLDFTMCSIPDFCGPSHRLARWAALLLYSGVIFEYGWSAHIYWGHSCTDDNFKDLVAKAVGITVAGICGYLEFKCMKYMILPWQQNARGFKLFFLPCWHVPYGVWLLFNQSLSLLSQVTLQANAHLAGSMLACHHKTGVENFCSLILTVGMVLICVMPVISMIVASPFPWVWDEKGNKKRQKVSWAFGRDFDPDGRPGYCEVRFLTWLQWLWMHDWASTHYEATLEWGGGAFMQCVGSVAISFPAAEMELFFQKMTDNPNMVMQYLRRFIFICRKAFFFMLTVGLMKSTVQLMAQVSLYDVLKHEAPNMARDKMNTLVMNFLATLGTEVGVVKDVIAYGYTVLIVEKSAAQRAIVNMAGPGCGDPLPDSRWWFTKFFIVSSLALLSWAASLGWFLTIMY